jgi:hypothetical protein
VNRRVRSFALVVASVALVASGFSLASVHADPDNPNGGDVTNACRSHEDSAPYIGTPACRSIQNGQWQDSALCRTPLYASPDPAATESCAAIDGRPISDAAIATYQSSWVHQALARQRDLDEQVPLTETLLPHTHNSFNASQYRVPTDGSVPTYYPTLTNQDSNQVYDITGQLNMDVRAIEIDLHWVPSPYGSAATGGHWVTLCHGSSVRPPVPGSPLVHVGCSADRPMEAGLKEVAAWLASHPDEFVLLYLENQMGGSEQAHAIAGDLIEQDLGDYVLPTPAGQPCASMPMDQSKAQLKAEGHRVVIVGNCDAGAATSWGALVHERGPRWDESGDPDSYDASACAADQSARQNDTTFRRSFEDSTWVAAMAGSNPVTSSLGGTSHITAQTAADMVRCGVNIIGLDQLTPDDSRLAALVWSWAPDQLAAAGGCADQRGDTRFEARDCTTALAFACVDGAGAWHVTTSSGSWGQGFDTCATEYPGSHFAVPANGYRNALLAAAKTGAGTVWLNYAQTSAGWTPNQPAPFSAAALATGPNVSGRGTAAGAARAVSPRSSSPALRRAADATSTGAWGLLLALALGAWVFGAGLWIRRGVSSRRG